MNDRKAILITGAAGFVGRAVVRELQQSGERIVLLDAAPIADQGPTSFTTLIACDICDVRALRNVFEAEEIGGIIHLAAILPTAASKDPLRATQVNVTGGLNLLEMAREFGIRRFVFGSSLSIYGTYPAEQTVSETFRCAPQDVYGAAKLYVEQLGNVYADRYGIEFAGLRIGRVIGPGAQSHTSAWRSQIFEFLRESHRENLALPYIGTERVLLVHVHDVAKSLVAVLQAPRRAHSVYNAPCESVVVEDLKRQVESLNPKIHVMLGDAHATGNPRCVDWSRFQREFGLEVLPVFEQLRGFVAGDLNS